jgi:hypothetical protein
MIKHYSKPKKRLTFEELVESDTLGLFDGVKASKKKAMSGNNPAIEVFEKINVFFEKYHREPADSSELEEAKLARALSQFRTKDNLKEQVIDLDRFELLNEAPVKKKQNEPVKLKARPIEATLESLDDIFESGLLDDDSSDIFNLKHIQKPKTKPDQVAQRKKCPDFHKYETFFELLDQGVKNREVDIRRFRNGSQIRLGDIFISGGIYCTVVNIGEYREAYGRYDPRLRVIFSNGTESNLLLRSLEKSLYEDPNGKRIIRGAESVYEQFGVDQTPEGAIKTGEIYFLRSLSERPEIKAIPNLIKIGVTTGTTHKRIENAATEKTYLEAPVEVLEILPCYNLNVGNLENLIHHKLHDRRKNITISSPGGGIYKAREWFDVSLDEAIKTVQEIMNN